jgi:hypothetical protein
MLSTNDVDTDESRRPDVIRILRWVVLLPGVVLGSSAAFVLIAIINRVTTYMTIGPSPTWYKLWEMTTGMFLFGALIPYLAFRIAPSQKQTTAFVCSGLALLLYGGGMFFWFDRLGLGGPLLWRLVGVIAMNVGSIGVSYGIHKGEIGNDCR